MEALSCEWQTTELKWISQGRKRNAIQTETIIVRLQVLTVCFGAIYLKM